MYNGSAHAYQIMNGNKINKLTLSCEGPGQVIDFDADINCQWSEIDTDKAVTTIQAVTLGAEPATVGKICHIWSGLSQRNIAGAGLVTWYPQKWKLIVDNHLTPQSGNKQGADTNWYPVTVGLDEGVRDIIFEADLVSDSQTYHNMIKDHTLMTSVTIPIGSTYTITLSNGYAEPGNYPSYKQALNTETVKFRFKSLTIA